MAVLSQPKVLVQRLPVPAGQHRRCYYRGKWDLWPDVGVILFSAWYRRDKLFCGSSKVRKFCIEITFINTQPPEYYWQYQWELERNQWFLTLVSLKGWEPSVIPLFDLGNYSDSKEKAVLAGDWDALNICWMICFQSRHICNFLSFLSKLFLKSIPG